MADAVDYMIEDKGSYSGNIGCIMEKNTQKKWVSEIPFQMIVISLKLKNPTYISRIECKGNQTQTIEVTFKDIDKDPIDSTILNFDYTKDDCIMRNIEYKQMTAFVELKLKSNNGKPKPMGLNYIIFRGNINPLKPTKQKITNLTKQQNIEKLKLDTFKAPTKVKPIQASRPYRNVPLPSKFPFNQRQKRNQNQKYPQNEDMQYQKAIKESERTYKEEQIKMKTLKDKNSEFQIQNDKDDSDTIPLAPQRKYQVAPLSQMIDSFRFVNSKWLEAQKRAEQQLGVKEQEKLSNYIQIKYLLNKEIYIDSDSIKGQRKTKLQNIAEKLGAKIINVPRKNCIFISTSWDNSSVQKAIERLSNIKAVNEDYLIDCIKVNAELDWKDYSLKKRMI